MVTFNRQAIEQILNMARAQLLVHRRQIERDKELLRCYQGYTAKIIVSLRDVELLEDTAATQLAHADKLLALLHRGDSPSPHC